MLTFDSRTDSSHQSRLGIWDEVKRLNLARIDAGPLIVPASTRSMALTILRLSTCRPALQFGHSRNTIDHASHFGVGERPEMPLTFDGGITLRPLRSSRS